MNVYLRTKFQASSTTHTSFRQGWGWRGVGSFTPPPPSISKRTPKKPTQIRVKQSLVLFLLICFQTIFMYLLVRYVTNTSLAILLNFKTIFIYIITIFSKASMQLFKRQNSFHLRSLNQCVELLIFEQKINLALILVSEMVLS